MWRIAAVVVVLGLGLSASAAAGPLHPAFPTCGALSAARVTRVVGIGRLYLAGAIAHRTSCTYYGVPAAKATKLATTLEQPCDPQLRYDNWVGPPECDGEPALKKVAVIAYVPTGGGRGRLVNVAAAGPAPGPLSLSHILELARQTVTASLY